MLGTLISSIAFVKNMNNNVIYVFKVHESADKVLNGDETDRAAIWREMKKMQEMLQIQGEGN